MTEEPPDRIAVCQAPNGPNDYVPLKPGETPPTSCFMDCDCKPVVYLSEHLVRRTLGGMTI